MNEVELKFERENLSGLLAVGTYLSDAAKRFGIELPGENFEEKNFSVVKIIKGGELLSAPTKTENELLSASRRGQGERLAEQAKIEKAGEIIVMSTEKKVEEKAAEEDLRDKYRKDFEELPLQKKIAALLELESIAFSETLSFIFNSPSKLVSMGMDILAEMGLKMEDEARKQARPAEHQPADGEPSVRDESWENVTNEPTEPPPPSVEEEKPDAQPMPSVKEEKRKVKKPDEVIEPPPPSILENKSDE